MCAGVITAGVPTAISIRLSNDQSAINHRPHHFFNKKRVAIGFFENAGTQFVRQIRNSQ
jgi:hypothetical protein